MHVALAVLLVALSIPAKPSDPWPKQPKDFRGLAFGVASEKDVATQLKLDAFACLEIEGQRTCLHHGALGDVRVSEIYTFEDDKFVQVHISFKPDRYPIFIDQFVQQYGQAGETWVEPFETVGGGDHANEISLWNGDKIVIQVEKFGPSIRESTAVIATRAWYDKTAEAEE